MRILRKEFMQPAQKPPVPVSPQPGEEMPISESAISPSNPRHSKKKLIIIISSVFLLLIAASIAMIISAQGEKNTEQSSTKKQINATQNNASKDSFDDSFDIIKGINNALTEQFTVTTDGKTDNGTISIFKGTNAPIAKLTDYKYFVTIDSGSSISVDHDANRLGRPDSDGIKILAIFKNKLETAGLKLVTDSSQLLDASQVQYRNDTYTCDLYDANSTPMGISCGKNADYAPVAKKYQPYYDAYIAHLSAIKAATEKVGFSGEIKLTDGATAGYRLATVSMSYGYSGGIEGGMGMFWSKNNGAWNFFDISQASHACSDLKTDDERNAYVGATCTSDKVF